MTKFDSCLEFLTRPMKTSNGLKGIGDVKLYLALAMYIISFIFLARDPFFTEYGGFAYRQGVLTLLLSFVVFSTFNWEICLFGKPTGVNLLGQIFQFLPFSLFVTRLSAKPSVENSPSSVIGIIQESVKQIGTQMFGDVINEMPPWFSEIFTNWRIALLLLLILLVLCLKGVRQKLAAVLLIVFIQLASLLTSSHLACFLIGTFFLLGGMSLQFCRYDRILYYENVIRKLKTASDMDSLFAAVACRLMRGLEEEEDCGENNFLSLVKSEYSSPEHPLSNAELKVVASSVLHRLVYEFHLVRIKCDKEGLKLQPSPSLFVNDSLLTMLAVWPRIVLGIIIAILWMVLPIDGIPDAIPYVGMLDDAFVAIISAVTIRNTLLTHNSRT